MGKFQDLTGQRFGRLTVIERVENNKRGNIQWLCKCECGNFTKVITNNLKTGKTKSCGCLVIEKASKMNRKHGLRKTRLYNIWALIKRRTLSENCKRYHRYGGRGITICNEWKNDFKNFYDWAMKNGYKDDLTIDRIDNNGNYEPKNCRWVSNLEQSRNKCTNHFLTFNNKTLCIVDWAKEIGIKRETIQRRLENGWSVDKTLTTPVRKGLYNGTSKVF